MNGPVILFRLAVILYVVGFVALALWAAGVL